MYLHYTDYSLKSSEYFLTSMSAKDIFRSQRDEYFEMDKELMI